MGYLDSSTITVDAVLTKKGRELLSTPGGSLNISQFTLSDTGVDYNLWNTGHPSGSTYYGEAIENLPQTEALPNSQFAVRNKLVTMGQGMDTMPALVANVESHTFTTSSDGSHIIYPKNHWIRFANDFSNRAYRGYQNVNPGIFPGKEKVDYTSASFYRHLVKFKGGTAMQDNPDLDPDGNLI